MTLVLRRRGRQRTRLARHALIPVLTSEASPGGATNHRLETRINLGTI